nr:laccase domain-containing protein [Pseudomonas sp.]
TQPGTVVAVLTADCLPVVIADVAATVVCVAHAGWRGLASGVLEAAVSAVYERRGPDVQLQAWVGPGIGPSAFEVGADVRDAFADMPQAFSPSRVAPGKWWCNLPWLAEQRLRSAGVVTVVQSGFCTASEKEFYSYRRDGVTGRFATVAWLESAG